ncbi:MAG: HYC_CC_PP family protein [Bacteroidota bacterium]|jgi:hypothetical protein|nr:hypothetical protein [Flammeovirgaceae bacterium]MCZ8071852.1 hypothetical protein [Cytophagales bacterium]
MVKRAFLISLSIIYLALSVGVAKSTHFCMGRAKHTAVFSFDTKKCVCAKYNPANSCCDDEYELVQIKDDQAGTQLVDAPAPHFNLIADLFGMPAEDEMTNGISTLVDEFPDPPKIPIYKKAHSFLFYDSQV